MEEGRPLGLHSLLSVVHSKQWLCQSLGRGLLVDSRLSSPSTPSSGVSDSLTTLLWTLEVSAHR